MQPAILLPRPPSRRDDVLTWARQMHDFVRAITPHNSPTVLCNMGRDGTSFTANVVAGGGAPPASVYPFDLTISPNDEGDDDGAAANVVPGCAQNLVPDNILDDVDLPTTLSYLYVEVQTDGATVQSSTIKISDVAPAPVENTMNSLPTIIPVLIHLIDYDPPAAGATVGTYTPYRVFWPPGNILLTSAEVYRTSVDNPAPGTLPYDIWYNWSVGSTYQPPINQDY